VPNVGSLCVEPGNGVDVHISVSSGIIGAISEITVSDARARLADVVDASRVGHEPVYLTRRGQRVAAVIDADDLDRLITPAEDLADIEAAKAARAEIADGDATIPWEQVRADLGPA
jgi:prevent-host-death family protein